jgi:hypothetical protein
LMTVMRIGLLVKLQQRRAEIRRRDPGARNRASGPRPQ